MAIGMLSMFAMLRLLSIVYMIRRIDCHVDSKYRGSKDHQVTIDHTLYAFALQRFIMKILTVDSYVG